MNPFTAALVAMRRSPYQTLAAIIMLTVTCVVGYSFAWLGLGTHFILRFFETRPQVIAFFELDAPSEAISALESDLNAKDYISEIKIVTKEEALELYRSTNQDNPLLLELVTSEILPASIEVSADTPEALPLIREDLESADYVEEVAFQEDVIASLSSWTRAIRWIGIGSVAVLGVTSFVIIMLIIGIKITNRRQAIHIMRMLGATRWYIKWPFVIEGMLYGLLGSLIGWGIVLAALLYLTPWLRDFVGDIPLFPIPPEVYAVQLGIGTAVAVILGAFASLTTSQRLIRQ